MGEWGQVISRVWPAAWLLSAPPYPRTPLPLMLGGAQSRSSACPYLPLPTLICPAHPCLLMLTLPLWPDLPLLALIRPCSCSPVSHLRSFTLVWTCTGSCSFALWAHLWLPVLMHPIRPISCAHMHLFMLVWAHVGWVSLVCTHGSSDLVPMGTVSIIINT